MDKTMMRLDKYLSYTLGQSRKEVKKLIRQKKVTINGLLVLDDDAKVNPDVDSVEVLGQLVFYQSNVVIMVNKPAGVISASTDNNQTTIMDVLDLPQTDLFIIGRLDKDTEGLLLLTNDGQLSHQLTSNKKNIFKTYEVTLKDSINQTQLNQLTQGVIIEQDYKTKPAICEQISENKIILKISEGKFHQIKQMIQAIDNQVIHLKRVAIGACKLDPTLESGQWRFLTADEIADLTKNSK